MVESSGTSRRHFLQLGGAAGAGLALAGAQPFAAYAEPARPSDVELVDESAASTLWYHSPADESLIIQQGLPIGNGRRGALTGCDPADDFLYVTDNSFWTGGRND